MWVKVGGSERSKSCCSLRRDMLERKWEKGRFIFSFIKGGRAARSTEGTHFHITV